MNIQLKRPLVVFDLETTGINTTTDRIVEFYFIKLQPNGEKEVVHERINPGIPIPKEATAVHGITDEDVKDKLTFKQLAHKLDKFLENCDFGGFNSNKFDFPMLVEEFYRAGVDFETENRKFVDAQRIFHSKEPRNLEAAFRFYCNKTLENAHSAQADTEATLEILMAQVDKYEDLRENNTIEFMHKFSGQNNLVDLAGRIVYDGKGIETFNFGKYRGKPVKEVFNTDLGYYDWIMKSEFPLQTKKVLTRIRLSQIKDN